MTHADDSRTTETGPNEQSESALRRAQEAERSAIASAKAAADGLARSAVSQDRTAEAFERAADSLGNDNLRDHAAQHRDFAAEDRRMAEQLREDQAQ